jgi:UDP-N-acetylmuramoyl-tripeptide--D-alanyl-D-alanine ligase
VTLDARARPGFELSHGSERVAVSLQMAGAHQAANAAAAAAAAVALGVPLAEAAERMAGAVGSPWRMEIHAGRFTVVNDAYNANPDSVESALRSVAEMGGRHHAVLGLMAELGSVTEEEHRRIGRLAGDLGFELVVVGEDHGIAAGAGRAAVSVATSAEAERLVLRRVRPGDVVLVKASRVAGLEDLAGRLVDAAEEPAP